MEKHLFIKDNRLVTRCVKHNPRISQRFIYLLKVNPTSFKSTYDVLLRDIVATLSNSQLHTFNYSKIMGNIAGLHTKVKIYRWIPAILGEERIRG
jgi:hypothetical protein